MPKFSAEVSQKLLNVVGTARINEGLSKGVAVEYMLHLARLKPDVEIINFGSETGGSCNLGLKSEQMEAFKNFRTSHNPVLDGNGQFFIAALKLGASAYERGYRLSDKKALDKAQLVEPKDG